MIGGLMNISAGEHFFHSEVGETDFSITPAGVSSNRPASTSMGLPD